MDCTADVVVIGAGIAGTATAYYLAKGGSKVIVCEKGEIAGEQSSRNWGFVRQQGRDPAEIPLMMESNNIWRGLERELNADLEWLQAGNMVTFSNAEEGAGWEGWRQTAAEFGQCLRLLRGHIYIKRRPGRTQKGYSGPGARCGGAGRRISYKLRGFRSGNHGRLCLRRGNRTGYNPCARCGLRRRCLVRPDATQPGTEIAADVDQGLRRADHARTPCLPHRDVDRGRLQAAPGWHL